jgi:fatty-acyl-CoA synthase
MDATLFTLLQRAAETGSDDQGYRYLDRRERETFRTFPDLADRTGRIAAGLTSRGVKSGDTVAIVLPTTPDFTDIFFACCCIGAIPVPLYPPVRLGRLEEYFERTARMLEVSGASILVTDARAGKLMGSVVSRFMPRAGVHRVADLLEDSPADFVPPQADDIAMVQFSSGTTGLPKPVALTHRQVLANADAVLDIIPRDGPFKPSGVSWLPLYHDMGLIGCVMPAMMFVAELTLIPPEVFLAKPSIWLRAISQYKGIISPAPNFAYALAAERVTDDEMEGVDLSCWQYALNGAEPVNASTMRAFIDRFSRWGLSPESLNPVYGLSEAALAVTFADGEAPFRSTVFDRDALASGLAQPAEVGVELVSVGRPLRGFSIQIRDDSRESVADETVGDLWVRGPSVMERYLDGSPPPKDGEWLDTGDQGFILDSELYITGRRKDVIVVRGQNHSPQSLETAIDSVEGVRTGCSAAVSSLEEDGEKVLVFVETRTDAGSELAEQCRAAVLASTGVNPDLVVPLAAGTLPRTSSGKIRRGEALNRWRAGELTPPAAVTPMHLAGALARSAWSHWTTRMRRD